MSEQSGLIWRSGHFEVDGVKTKVPDYAEFPEIRERLVGHEITSVDEDDDAYFLRLDDGQLVEVSGIWHNDSTAGTGIRFWNRPFTESIRE